MRRFKLTTECGYNWRWDQMYYWDDLRPRKLDGDGIAVGPIMFFWNWTD